MLSALSCIIVLNWIQKLTLDRFTLSFIIVLSSYQIYQKVTASLGVSTRITLTPFLNINK